MLLGLIVIWGGRRGGGGCAARCARAWQSATSGAQLQANSRISNDDKKVWSTFPQMYIWGLQTAALLVARMYTVDTRVTLTGDATR